MYDPGERTIHTRVGLRRRESIAQSNQLLNGLHTYWTFEALDNPVKRRSQTFASRKERNERGKRKEGAVTALVHTACVYSTV